MNCVAHVTVQVHRMVQRIHESFRGGCVKPKIINPPFKLKQTKERIATSSTQEVTDRHRQFGQFQNNSPCADRFILFFSDKL